MNKIVIFQNLIFRFFEKDPILAKNTMHIKEVFMRHVALSLSVSQSGVLNILYASLFDWRRKRSNADVFASALQSR